MAMLLKGSAPLLSCAHRMLWEWNPRQQITWLGMSPVMCVKTMILYSNISGSFLSCYLLVSLLTNSDIICGMLLEKKIR